MGESLNINEDGGDAGMGAVSKAITKDKLRMTAGQIIDNLVDIVSKNGNMMLNVGLRADGSLPETFREELVKIGKWLKMNGEAIYETRPFKVYGEGTFCKNADANKKKYADNLYTYTAEDLRFTTKRNVVYVIAMDWPGNGKTIQVKHLNKKDAGKVRSVIFVADGKKLKWEQKEEGLYITMPPHAIGEYAYAFKVNMR